MELTCKTEYDWGTLTVMSRALRKTVRAKVSRSMRICSWITIAGCLLSICLSWGHPWWVMALGTVVVLLLLVSWKEDALDGYFASRKALPGTGSTSTTFYPDYYEVKMTGATTQWQYNKILALAEDQQYIILVLGRNHAQALKKDTLEGGELEELRALLQKKTGRPILALKG